MAKKYLIVRTDRVGDVLLTTPLNAAIRAADPEAQIAWLVRPYTAPLLENNPDVDQVILDKDGRVGALVEALKPHHFDAGSRGLSALAWGVGSLQNGNSYAHRPGQQVVQRPVHASDLAASLGGEKT